MSNAPSTNPLPLPTDDIHHAIPLLAKEGLGVVDRRSRRDQPRPTPPLRRGGEAWRRARDGDLKPDCFWGEGV